MTASPFQEHDKPFEVKFGKVTWTKVQKGDTVIRWMGGEMFLPLKVTDVDEKLIRCGDWTFSRENGAEIDPELGWDETRTGSRLVGYGR